MSSVFLNQGAIKTPPNAATIQKLLDENTQLIMCIAENQNKGNAAECISYQQVLHRNLVYLATIADYNQQNMQYTPPSYPTNVSNSQTPSNRPPPPLGERTMIDPNFSHNKVGYPPTPSQTIQTMLGQNMNSSGEIMMNSIPSSTYQPGNYPYQTPSSTYTNNDQPIPPLSKSPMTPSHQPNFQGPTPGNYPPHAPQQVAQHTYPPQYPSATPSQSPNVPASLPNTPLPHGHMGNGKASQHTFPTHPNLVNVNREGPNNAQYFQNQYYANSGQAYNSPFPANPQEYGNLVQQDVNLPGHGQHQQQGFKGAVTTFGALPSQSPHPPNGGMMNPRSSALPQMMIPTNHNNNSSNSSRYYGPPQTQQPPPVNHPYYNGGNNPMLHPPQGMAPPQQGRLPHYGGGPGGGSHYGSTPFAPPGGPVNQAIAMPRGQLIQNVQQDHPSQYPQGIGADSTPNSRIAQQDYTGNVNNYWQNDPNQRQSVQYNNNGLPGEMFVNSANYNNSPSVGSVGPSYGLEPHQQQQSYGGNNQQQQQQYHVTPGNGKDGDGNKGMEGSGSAGQQ